MARPDCVATVRVLSHACLAGLWLAAPAAAQTVKLNGPFVEPVIGRVQTALHGAQGERVVYYASQEVPYFMQLYSVPADRSTAPVRLSPDGVEVEDDLEISGDGAMVAFLVGRTLYVALTDGSQPALALDDDVPGDSDTSLLTRFSPDANWLVYRETAPSLQISSVPTDGVLPPVLLAQSGGDYFEITHDSQLVVFRKGGNLFSVPINGSTAATQLTVTSVGSVAAFRITVDDAMVVFVGDLDVFNQEELYQVPIDGSASPIKLNGAIVAGGDVGEDLEPTADSTRVIYRADQDVDGTFELYAAPVDGSTSSVKLSGAIVAGGDVTGFGFVLTPDAQNVVFLADRETDETLELYLVPAAGGVAPVKLHPPLPAGGDVWGNSSIRITPDSLHAIYHADLVQDEVFELFAVNLTGTPSSMKLNAPLGANGDVGQFALSLDGQSVVYSASLLADGRSGSFSVPVLGGASAGLTPTLAQGGSASIVWPGPDGRGIYLADPDGLSGQNAYSIPLDASASASVLNEALPAGGVGQKVYAYRATSAGEVVYLADQERHHKYELYRVSALGGEAVKLNGTLVFGGSVGAYQSPPYENFALSPDGSRFAYIANQDTVNQFELYGGPLDGSSPPVRMNDVLDPEAGVLAGMTFAPDGSRVLYRAYLDSAGMVELFSVPADGSAAPAKVNLALVANGDVQPDFELGTDGEHLVYRADGGTNEKFELYVGPVDGTGLRKRLNPNLLSDRDVTAFDLAPGNARVLYLSDQGLNERFDLYSVPTDGSSVAIRLNDPVVADRDVLAFVVGPDGSRVAYVADQISDEVRELFVVPITGGTPLQLNTPLVAGGDVDSSATLRPQFSPDATRIVYLADADVDQRFELYSVPADASAAAVKVSGTMVAGGSVTAFEVTPDNRSVVFLANRDLVGTRKLWIAPLSGATAPRELSAPPTGGQVYSFVLDDVARQALYLIPGALFRTKLYGAPEPQVVTSGMSSVGEVQWMPFPSASHPLVLYSTFELFASRIPKKHESKPF